MIKVMRQLDRAGAWKVAWNSFIFSSIKTRIRVIDGIHFFAHRLEPLLLSAMTCNSRPERMGLPVTKEEFDTETESPQQKKLDAASNRIMATLVPAPRSWQTREVKWCCRKA
jgi:hypothetical protein